MIGQRVAGSRLGDVRDNLRTQLWPVPTLGVVLAVAAGIVLPRVDRAADANLSPWLAGALFGGGAGEARTVLDAVASSLITVTSLTFSLTVVTLQLASSQYSPRLLRTFARDRFVHVTLALFMATFTFALTVLRTVRSADETRDAFVPKISVTAALLLAILSVVALVLFLAHLASEIRVETVLRTVHAESKITMDAILGEHEGPQPDRCTPPLEAVLLPAAESGFLVRVDEKGLLAAAQQAGAVVLVEHMPGASVVAGVPLALAWSVDGGPLASDARDRLQEALDDGVVLGSERTSAQDVAFGLRQITDVAVKALSPGVNDPTTAVHALSHSAALLCTLAGRRLGDRLMTDDDGRVRVVLRRPALADLLDLAVAQPRRYGAGEPAVLARIAGLLREVAWCAPVQLRSTVLPQVALLRATVDAQSLTPAERAPLAAAVDQVEHAVAGRW